MSTSSRALVKVVERTIKPIYLADRYHSFIVYEILECGHRQTAFPQADPLVARYRVCLQCVEDSGERLPPKKPARAVRSVPRRTDRAA